jgi:hypothetical protein
MPPQALAEWVKLGSEFGTFISLAIAIVVFWMTKQKERLEREYAAYHALDEKYSDYLKQVVEHPHLDLYSTPLKNAPNLKPEEKIQESATFEMLVCLMERAFLMYRNQSSKLRQAQWDGWEAYIKEWCQRENFRRLWREVGKEFDAGFVEYMGQLVDSANRGMKQ